MSSPTFGDPRLPERFWSKVRVDDSGCWTWTPPLLKSGYAAFHLNGKNRRAHRVAYESLSGPLIAGLVIDHLCRVRHCVNPAHLEQVTEQVNILRGTAPTAVNAAKVLCKRGHELQITKKGNRKCQTCDRALKREGERRARIQRGGKARLTASEAAEIRRLHAAGSGTALIAHRFGVNRSTIQRIAATPPISEVRSKHALPAAVRGREARERGGWR